MGHKFWLLAHGNGGKVWTGRGPCDKFLTSTKKHSFVAKFGEKAVDRVPSFM